MFNMQMECKQDLKCKLKGARISLYTQPHDNSFRAYSMSHIQFISCEMREIKEFNSNYAETDLNNAWKMSSSGMLRRVDLVWTDVSEERITSRYIPPKRHFTQDLHSATSQKTAFFIVTAVKTSNLTLK
jgi:hypothetical protein